MNLHLFNHRLKAILCIMLVLSLSVKMAFADPPPPRPCSHEGCQWAMIDEVFQYLFGVTREQDDPFVFETLEGGQHVFITGTGTYEGEVFTGQEFSIQVTCYEPGSLDDLPPDQIPSPEALQILEDEQVEWASLAGVISTTCRGELREVPIIGCAAYAHSPDTEEYTSYVMVANILQWSNPLIEGYDPPPHLQNHLYQNLPQELLQDGPLINPLMEMLLLHHPDQTPNSCAGCGADYNDDMEEVNQEYWDAWEDAKNERSNMLNQAWDTYNNSMQGPDTAYNDAIDRANAARAAALAQAYNDFQWDTAIATSAFFLATAACAVSFFLLPGGFAAAAIGFSFAAGCYITAMLIAQARYSAKVAAANAAYNAAVAAATAAREAARLQAFNQLLIDTQAANDQYNQKMAVASSRRERDAQDAWDDLVDCLIQNGCAFLNTDDGQVYIEDDDGVFRPRTPGPTGGLIPVSQ